MSSLQINNSMALATTTKRTRFTVVREALQAIAETAKRKPALTTATGFTGLSLVAGILGSLLTAGISGAAAMGIFIASIFTRNQSSKTKQREDITPALC